MLDGKVFTYKYEDDRNLLYYLDENDFTKKMRAIKKYHMNAYKYWIFEAVPKLQRSNKIDGNYELELPVDEDFKKVYGYVKVSFSVKNDVVVIENLTPHDILMAMFMKELPTYKGVPYRNNKDKFKIELIKEIKNER